jgi:multicomponent Na+:H+ antiporter subunit G
MLIAAIGIVRMPDLYMRLQVASKAVTLGAGCMLLAVAIAFGSWGMTVRAMATVVFFFLTVPVASHLIGRAAYCSGAPMWKGTQIDELRGNYDPVTHAFQSGPWQSEQALTPLSSPVSGKDEG